ncbi:ubiquitin-specific protease doa4 [Rhizophlyctis rosea]|nr:ubiquitin-specific protease doa4 [Rhizophlyctis rosea]
MDDLENIKAILIQRCKEYEERFPAKGPKSSPQMPRSAQFKLPNGAAHDSAPPSPGLVPPRGGSPFATATPPPQSSLRSNSATPSSASNSTPNGLSNPVFLAERKSSGVYDLSKSLINPTELYEVLNEARLSVLLIDVRGDTDWLAGHVRWNGWGAGGGGVTTDIPGGVIHLDGDWLNSQTDSNHIEFLMSNFPSSIPTSSPQNPVYLFSRRNLFDLVVIYDGFSSSQNDSHVLQNVIQTIWGMEVSKRLKNAPRVLFGGWAGWMQFLQQWKSSGLSIDQWVESGSEVADASQGVPTPLRMLGKSVGAGANVTAGVGGASPNGSVTNNTIGGYARSVGDFVAQRTQQFGGGSVSSNVYQGNTNGHNPFGASTNVTIGDKSSAAPVIVSAAQPYAAVPNYGGNVYGVYGGQDGQLAASGLAGNMGMPGSFHTQQDFASSISNPFFGMGGTQRTPSPPQVGAYDGMAGARQDVVGYPALAGRTMPGQGAYMGQVGAYPSLPVRPTPIPAIPPTQPTSITPPNGSNLPMVPGGPSGLVRPPYQPLPPGPSPLQPSQMQPSPPQPPSISQQPLQPIARAHLPSKPLPVPPIGPPVPNYMPGAYPSNYLPPQLQVPQPVSIRRSSSPSPSPSTARFYGSVAPQRLGGPPVPPKPSGLSRSGSGLDGTGSRFEFGFSQMGMAGLRNMGNTCFMNSIIQCLSGTVPLARYFNDGSYKRHINKTNTLGTRGDIAQSFAELIRMMWSESGGVVVPGTFKERVGDHHPSFRGNEQQDSQEFLAFVLDSMHEDLNVARKSSGKIKEIKANGEEDEEMIPDEILMDTSWSRYTQLNWSIIVDMFQGVLKSRLQCMTCGKTSTTFNPFMYLTLPVPQTRQGVQLEQCLDEFVKEEILDGNDAWRCPKCKVPRRTRKQLTIAKLPVVLLVHLKRFYFQGPFRNRIDTYVHFPIKRLDLTRYMPANLRAHQKRLPRPMTVGYPQQRGNYGAQGMPGAPMLPPKPEEYLYDLYAVSNHSGGLNGGHYTAQVKYGQKNQWYNFDDSRVTPCQEQDVQTSQAYILFYWRARPDPVPSMAEWWINR